MPIQDMTSIQITSGNAIATFVAIAKEGNTFDGWFSDSTFTNTWSIMDNIVTQDTTLYAKWAPDMFTIRFENSYDATYVQSTIAAYGTTIAPPATLPEREGYVVTGWTRLGTLWNFETDVVKDDTYPFIAVWAPASYTVTFNSNGGSSVAPVTIVHGNSITAPETPTKADSVFVA